jgi:hypothetical protein
MLESPQQGRQAGRKQPSLVLESTTDQENKSMAMDESRQAVRVTVEGQVTIPSRFAKLRGILKGTYTTDEWMRATRGE